MGFLYFVPGVKNIQREDYGQLGLDHLNGLNPASRECTSGPDGGPGVVFFPFRPSDKSENRVGYYPEEQTWKKRKQVWVGWWNDDVPTPESLERGKVESKYNVSLCDGKKWAMPCAPALPVQHFLDEDDKLVAGRLKEYQRLYEIAERFEEAIRHGGDIEMEEAVKLVSEALSFNYHISSIEIGAIGLLSSENIRWCIHALLDTESFLRVCREYEEAKAKKSNADAAA